MTAQLPERRRNFTALLPNHLHGNRFLGRGLTTLPSAITFPRGHARWHRFLPKQFHPTHSYRGFVTTLSYTGFVPTSEHLQHHIQNGRKSQVANSTGGLWKCFTETHSDARKGKVFIISLLLMSLLEDMNDVISLFYWHAGIHYQQELSRYTPCVLLSNSDRRNLVV